MIAVERQGRIKTAVKLLTLPLWGPLYLAIVGGAN